MSAVLNCCTDITNILLKAGANVEAKDNVSKIYAHLSQLSRRTIHRMLCIYPFPITLLYTTYLPI
jgi:hypothetical protein